MRLERKRREFSQKPSDVFDIDMASRDLIQSFAALPGLDSANADAQFTRCKLCGGPAEAFDVVDFNKLASIDDYYMFGFSGIPIIYYRCGFCELLFTTAFDNWSTLEFSAHIYNADYIKVDPEYDGIRPRRQIKQLERSLSEYRDCRILDFGSGTGVFAAEARDLGFSRTESYDPFSNPGWPEGKFQLITCFEVLEHAPSPLETLKAMKSLLAEDGVIIFSQCLQPPDVDRVRASWWYIAPRNGHISTFTETTLSLLACSVGLVFHSRGESMHAFSMPEPSDRAARMLGNVGPALAVLTLDAATGCSSVDWHHIEGAANRKFRWTARNTVTWSKNVLGSLVRRIKIRIPFVNEIQQGFAEGCRVELAGSPLRTKIVRRTIMAEGDIEGDCPVDITLFTPEPISPAELSGSRDKRKLGLAVRIFTQ